MIILEDTKENIAKGADIIRKGGLVAFPTETVYGLGADAFNPSAVAGIFEAKQRPFFDPLIVHIADITDIERLTSGIDSRASRLIERFWPGPLTVVLPKKDTVPDIVTSGLDTVAVRMPRHETALSLIREAGTPIAAPSANRFSCLSPTTSRHVMEQLGNAVDMILDGGQCTVGIESTIIKITPAGIHLLRPGGIATEGIEECAGEKIITDKTEGKPEAPGQLDYHYSPVKPVIITDDPPLDDERGGFLFFRKPVSDYPAERTFILSEKGDLREAAANLFSHLHALDTLNISRIYAQNVPEHGLGLGIMDRLKKASMKFKNS
ncbi:MAG TPA: L-threonylcarbamoyladenylate synthase [Spirochaetota bacterium]|nr:L-threonylcarbamoyladenylate synthase [Spirochaetota bacterium]